MDQHRDVVYRFLVASVGPDEADDCFQETFLAALRAYPRLRHGDGLRSWVLTIATRKAIDSGRARRRRPLATADVAALGESAAPDADGPADGGDQLWRAVRALPPRQRAALVHRYVLDQSYADVARALDSSEETARQHVHQALKRLRRGWPMLNGIEDARNGPTPPGAGEGGTDAGSA